MYPYFSICSSKLFQFGYLHACSSTPLGCPDLLNLNPSIMALSLYSTLLLSMTSSWVFLHETGITANLFILVLIFYFLSYWICFSSSPWVLKVISIAESCCSSLVCCDDMSDIISKYYGEIVRFRFWIIIRVQKIECSTDPCGTPLLKSNADLTQ